MRPGHIKNVLKIDWGTKPFFNRIVGKRANGVEFPTLAETRATFERVYSKGEKIDWRVTDSNDWRGWEQWERDDIPF